MSPDRPAGVRRRTFLGAGAAFGLAAPLAGAGALTASADERTSALRGRHAGSVRSALAFLGGVTDAYRTTGPRLAQSYQDASGLTDIAFVYDNALTVIALLAGGDVKHARAIGDALLYAQANDETLTDRRLRQAYHADTFVVGDGTRTWAHSGYEFGLVGTAVGDMAWSGIALAHLAHRTGVKAYLDGTVAIGRWIQQNTYSTTGLGGYTFGETAGLEGHKSSEHNIDLTAYFRLLARLTGDTVWRDRADHAWAFVERVWNADDGFFWTGSDDGATVNTKATQLPLDVQTWSWLAVRDRRHAEALDWARTNLASTDTPLRANSALTGRQTAHGVVFASGSLVTDTGARIGGQDYNPKPDDGAVWFEGTGQLAIALRDRSAAGDADRAEDLLEQLRWAQNRLGQGQTFGTKRVEGGIVAASSPMDTGFGFGYYPNLHIAATSWYVFAATTTNPYRFF
ncbi:hypothetical protein SAMN04488543_4226 [Friedmanniella luteola]|uniref:Tat pathway signal sequence domain protein n=1 Tax=Friedmanniella luteola TaxID=546871 RepID=A0A1H2A527_9ACTN|nr:hypothetical protein [Friedmanniella luteola]SDT41065.1 hypothetical protein SAMN04488543_4226 [Friedmanniella luteola]